MKKSIFAASLLIAGVAMADSTTVETSYVLGVLPVTVEGNESILSIPWIESGTGVDGVAVTNLVKTAGLSAGDTLLWYNPANSRFESWYIVNNNGTNVWTSAITVNVDLTGKSFYSSMIAGSTALKRGQAVILYRGSSDEMTIYIVGGEGSAVEKTDLTVAAGTQALFAPPVVTNVDDLRTYLNGKLTPNVGDEVIITPTKKLVYRTSGWKYYTTTDNWATFSTSDTPELYAGNGLIYVNNGSNAVTIKF